MDNPQHKPNPTSNNPDSKNSKSKERDTGNRLTKISALIMTSLALLFLSALLSLPFKAFHGHFGQSGAEQQPSNPIDLGIILSSIPLMIGLYLFLDTEKSEAIFDPDTRGKIRGLVVSMLFGILALGLTGQILQSTTSKLPDPLLSSTETWDFISAAWSSYSSAFNFELFVYTIASIFILSVFLFLYSKKFPSLQEKKEKLHLIQKKREKNEQSLMDYSNNSILRMQIIFGLVSYGPDSHETRTWSQYIQSFLCRIIISSFSIWILIKIATNAFSFSPTGLYFATTILASFTFGYVEYNIFKKRKDPVLNMVMGTVILFYWILILLLAIPNETARSEVFSVIITLSLGWFATTLKTPSSINTFKGKSIEEVRELLKASKNQESRIYELTESSKFLQPPTPWYLKVLKNSRSRLLSEISYTELRTTQKNLSDSALSTQE